MDALGLSTASAAVCTATFYGLGRTTGWSTDARSRAVSTAHALISCTLSFVVYSQVAGRGPTDGLWDDSGGIWLLPVPAAAAAVALTFGYLVADTVLGSVHQLIRTSELVHHGVVCACYAAVLWGDAFNGGVPSFGANYAAMFLSMEVGAWVLRVIAGHNRGVGEEACKTCGRAPCLPLPPLPPPPQASTPFLNAHFALSTYMSPTVKLANGAAMWLSYASFRILFASYLITSVITTSTPPARTAAPVIWGIEVSVLACLCVLNCVWFWKITRGFAKAVRKSQRAAGGRGRGGGGGGGGGGGRGRHARGPRRGVE